MTYCEGEPLDSGLATSDVNELLDYEGVTDRAQRANIGEMIAATLAASPEDVVDFAAWESDQY
jgi:hypothetical protein